MNAPRPLESKIQKDIIKYLKTVPNLKYIKKDAGAYSTSGISDLLICYRGQFIAIEVKRPGEHPTPLQLKFLNDILMAGGGNYVAYDVEMVKRIVNTVAGFSIVINGEVIP